MSANLLTAEAACRAHKTILDDDDHLAVSLYHGAHAAHLDAYGASNPGGAMRAKSNVPGLWRYALKWDDKSQK